MIYLTGDVHSTIKRHFQQETVPNELNSSIKYLEILKSKKIKSTLFLNGRLLDENPEKIKEILKYDVEIGGHTYDNFGNKKMNKIKSYFYRKLFGCVYGPTKFQERDIKKTKKAFNKLGVEMASWRTHAFASNEKTLNLLKREGVRYISDFVGDTKPFEHQGLMHLPINIPPDNNSISYGALRPENRDPFVGCTKGRINKEEWLDILKKRIIKNEKNKVDTIILIHPAMMEALDNFELFKDVVKFLARYKTAKISEYKLK